MTICFNLYHILLASRIYNRTLSIAVPFLYQAILWSLLFSVRQCFIVYGYHSPLNWYMTMIKSCFEGFIMSILFLVGINSLCALDLKENTSLSTPPHKITTKCVQRWDAILVVGLNDLIHKYRAVSKYYPVISLSCAIVMPSTVWCHQTLLNLGWPHQNSDFMPICFKLYELRSK